mgnify:CR=1 FL=1
MSQPHVEIPVAETVHERHNHGSRIGNAERSLQTLRIRMDSRWHGGIPMALETAGSTDASANVSPRSFR